MIAEAPELWNYVRDFLLLLTVPTAFEFGAQPPKWRRSIRSLSEYWHTLSFLALRYSTHDALGKMFAAWNKGGGAE